MFSFDTVVLVVDDAMTTRNLMKKYLTEIGYKNFRQAPNAKDALSQLEASDSDIGLVFCDWNMPEMTGLELLIKVRANERLKKLPFILVTSERGTETVMQAIKAGVSNYIVKPFDKEGIITKIKATYQTIQKSEKVNPKSA